jgi:hypothetical protein
MALISVFSLWFGLLGVAVFMRHLNTRDRSQRPDQAIDTLCCSHNIKPPLSGVFVSLPPDCKIPLPALQAPDPAPLCRYAGQHLLLS